MLLLLVCVLACESAPPPAASPPAPAPLDLDLSGKKAELPWLQPAAAPALPAAPADPRALADQAFNTAMQAHETGDVDTAAVALPRALAAYQALPELDADGHFHVAVLLLANAQPERALVEAELVLAGRPTHLLALGVATRAALAAGDPARARAYAARTVAAYEAEQGQVAEYEHHGAALPIYREEARRLVEG